MVPRIVVGGAAHDGDQQAEFGEVKLTERLAEVELACKAKAVHGAITVLAQVDLIDIGIHEIRLGEMQLERDRHERFVHLAAHRLARIEEVALHQLLGERAAALRDLVCAQVHPQRAQHRLRINPMMAVELAIFDRLQRRGQQRRHFRRGDDDAILAMRWEDAADEQRIEAQDRHLVTRGIAQRLDRTRPRRDGDDARTPALIRKARGAQRDIDARVLAAIGAGAIERLRGAVA